MLGINLRNRLLTSRSIVTANIILGRVCCSARSSQFGPLLALAYIFSLIKVGDSCHCLQTITTTSLPADCADIQSLVGATGSGIFVVYRPGCTTIACATQVFCDLSLDNGGWTVVQRRTDNTQNFNQNWLAYRNGFGTVATNYWLGNQYLYERTNLSGVPYELLIQLTPQAGGATITALYDTFSIASETDSYGIRLGNLFQSGSSVDNLQTSRNQPFQTNDRGTFALNGITCGNLWQSGWWFSSTCDLGGDLNVPYDPVAGSPQLSGITWLTAIGTPVRVSVTEMKIRPVTFTAPTVGKRKKK